jgi:hypothetical protein
MKHHGPIGVARDPRVDAYVDAAAPFAQPILRHLRQAVHTACPGCTETMKWSMPFFVHQGQVLGHMAAFKQHCSFGVWVGTEPPAGDKDGKEGMGQFGRITALADLPPARELKARIKAAAAASVAKLAAQPAAKPVPKTPRRPPPRPPPDLAEALDALPAARAGFDALSPSQQREYVDWVTGAKQEATRLRRIAQTVALAAEGRSRYWKSVSG